MNIIEKKRKEGKIRKKSLHPCSELLAQFILHSYRGLPANTVLTRDELVQDCSDMLYFRFGKLPVTLLEDMIARLYETVQTTEYLLSKPIYKHLSDAERLILGRPFEKEVELARLAVEKGLPTRNIREDVLEMIRK